ncbi:hypothetical protein NEPTK9_000531 [Candidatus Neptunochlamydia vexilliferae]|uniref:Uncharacterized protein n=1 Tax=Candidatus Neptunichlamydia vexilliferae TaxID=1651774 RepID=A0ABS0AY17_9BACT|nr:hypothetical protein [Candidatus Neptunochlamydia vexilliferae]
MVPTPLFFSLKSNCITASAETLLRFQKDLKIFIGKGQLKRNGSFHTSYFKPWLQIKQSKKERCFLPSLKEGVSASIF